MSIEEESIHRVKVACDLLEEHGLDREASVLKDIYQYMESIIDVLSPCSRRSYILKHPDYGTPYYRAIQFLVEDGVIVPNTRRGKEHTYVLHSSHYAYAPTHLEFAELEANSNS